MLGKNYVVTFQEGPGDCFDLVRDRLRHEQSVMRQETQADYLAYRLIDAVVDAYFPVLEPLAIGWTTSTTAHRPARDKHPLPSCTSSSASCCCCGGRSGRCATRSASCRSRTRRLSRQTRLFFRDCHDHAIQLIDLVESYRDICSDMRDLHLSSVSNRMNEIMKTLTIISTIFIPLSFIAGVYGMNFDPDLRPGTCRSWTGATDISSALAIMACVAGIMLSYFKRHGWIFRGPAVRDALHEVQSPDRKP